MDTTGADLGIAWTSSWGTYASTGVTDPFGNTWNALTDYSQGTNHGMFYWSRPTVVGPGHVLSHYDQYTTNAFQAAFFSGSASSPLDGTSVGAGSTVRTPQVTPITPTEDGELIIFATAAGETTSFGIDSGFTLLDSTLDASAQVALAMYYLIQGTKAALNPILTLSAARNSACAIVAFKKGVLGAPRLFRPFP
jgi:hypothetical protein